MTRLWIIVGCLLAWPMAASAADPPAYQCDGDHKATSAEIEVTAAEPLIIAAMASAPTTRVRLSVDREDGGHHAEIEWDPALPGSTIRKLALPPGTYHLSFWVEPLLLTQLGGNEQARYVAVNLNCFKGSGNAVAAQGTTFDVIKKEGIQMPPLRVDVRRALPADARVHGLDLEASRAEASLRGLADPVPGTVDRVLRLIAEIAFERAQSRGFELLKKKVTKALCVDLTWEEMKVTAARGKVLPQTCSLIESVRLHDVASVASPLLGALRSDLQTSVLPGLAGAVIAKAKLPAQVRPLLIRAVDLATRVAVQDPNAARDAQLLLAEIGRVAWAQLEGSEAGDQLSTLLGLAFAVSGKLEHLDTAPDLLLERLGSELAKHVGAEMLDELKKIRPDLVVLTKEVDLAALTEQLEQLPKLRRGASADQFLAIARGLWAALPEAARREVIQELTLTLLVEVEFLKDAHLATVLRAFKAPELRALGAQLGVTASDEVELQALIPQVSTKLGAADRQQALAALKSMLKAMPNLVVRWIGTRHGAGVACGAQLLLAVANECIARGGCSAGDIADMVAHPYRYFRGTAEFPGQTCFDAVSPIMDELRQRWPRIDVVAQRAVFIAMPPRNARTADLGRAAIEIALELVAQLCGDRSECSELVPRFAAIVQSILDREPTLAMTRGVELIRRVVGDEKFPKKLTVAVEMAVAFTSYATADENSDEKAAEEARKARKQAIEALIDTATDRRGRDGEWIVSIGADPAVAGRGWQRLRAGTDWQGEDMRLQLPFGIAVQKMPLCSRVSWIGGHLMAFPIDLGQYIPTSAQTPNGAPVQSELKWHDLVTIGGQAALVFGSASNPFTVGVDLRWSPTLFDDVPNPVGTPRTGVYRFALFAGYYVPFFDLN